MRGGAALLCVVLASPLLRAELRCEGGFAGAYPCRGAHLLARIPPSSVASRAGSSVWGWTDPLNGDEYVLWAHEEGLSFVRITNPDARTRTRR
jgi:hypothetical protein